MAKVLGIGLSVCALAGIAATLWLFIDGLRARRETRRLGHPLPMRRPASTARERRP